MNAIEVKDLTKTFGAFTAVDHITFDVKKGEIGSDCDFFIYEKQK